MLLFFTIFAQVEDFRGLFSVNLPDSFDNMTATSLDYFLLLISLDLMNAITGFTNSYAWWRKEQATKEDPYGSKTSINKIRAFIDLKFMMGVNRNPSTTLLFQEPFRCQCWHPGNHGSQ
jgi:hypothetical protein